VGADLSQYDSGLGPRRRVIFLTLEDETGQVNVIVRPALVESQRKEVINASLLGVYGIWQCERNVRHPVARRLADFTPLLGDLVCSSGDFA
jgi:error-prone DNA polymerase